MLAITIAFLVGCYVGPAIQMALMVWDAEKDNADMTWFEKAVTVGFNALVWPRVLQRAEPIN